MERQFIPLGEASLAIDGLEVLDDELILVRGGLGARSGSGNGCGCAGGIGCGCGCSCAGGSGCGCGCGCSCSNPTVAPD